MLADSYSSARRWPSLAVATIPVATMPSFKDMVKEAIVEDKKRGGSSLQAIKKYCAV